MNADTNVTVEERPRALVLDHDSAALCEVQRSLEARRFAVLSAGDGTRGLGLLLDELLALDVLVTDLDLPHRDARSFARLIRRAGGERDLAIVVVAGDPTPHLRAELLSLGVDAVIDRRAGAEAAADAVLDVVRARSSRERAAAVPPRASAPAAGPAARWALSICRLPMLPA